MMMTALFVASALGASGDSIDARFAPFLTAGCIDGPPIAALQSDEGKPASEIPGLIDMPMSHDSFRFVISPDSYLGDGLLMVQIDSGLRRSLASNGQPFFLATVGNWRRTCTVRMPLKDCPKASKVCETIFSAQMFRKQHPGASRPDRF